MKSLIVVAAILAMPSMAIAQTVYCDAATESKQSCKVKLKATQSFSITAKATADAGDGHGDPQIKIHIDVDGDDCGENETSGWNSGPGSLEASCQTSLEPGEHVIKGEAISRDSKSTGFAMTVQEQ